MENSPTPAILDYSPRQKFAFFRRHRRKIAALLFVAIAVLAYLTFDDWGRPAWNRIVLLHYQRQCMAFQPAPDQIVFEQNDPTEFAKLLATPGYKLQKSDAFAGDSANWTAPSRTALERALPPRSTPTDPGATVFMHELRTPAGTSRLVILDLAHVQYFFSGYADGYRFRADLIVPATLTTPPSISTFEDFEHGATRILAGKMDPDDPARFTIECESGFQHRIMDGCLEDTPTGPALQLHYRNAESMSRKKLLEYYAKCAAYDQPFLVVYSTDPQIIMGVHADVDDYELDLYNGAARIFFTPRIWREAGFSSDTRTFFLHELSTTTGKHRLVHVAPLLVQPPTGISALNVSFMPPPTTTSPAHTPENGGMGGSSGAVRIPELLNACEVCGGQCDPDHPDRFKIFYRTSTDPGARFHVIEGRLKEDANHVEFRLEDGTVLTTDDP